jgi:uncharacterized protein YjbI with pentapeptide repeats
VTQPCALLGCCRYTTRSLVGRVFGFLATIEQPLAVDSGHLRDRPADEPARTADERSHYLSIVRRDGRPLVTRESLACHPDRASVELTRISRRCDSVADMEGLARRRRVWVSALVVCVSLGLPGLSIAAAQASMEEKERLEVEKLRAERDKLENDKRWYVWAGPTLLGVLTAVGAIAGLGIGWRQHKGQVKERERDLAGREREKLEQRKRESGERVDAEFADCAAKTASENVALRMSGLAALEAFLRPERADYHERLLSLLIGLVKIRRDPADPTTLALGRLLCRHLSTMGLRLRHRVAERFPSRVEMVPGRRTGSLKRDIDLDLRGAQLPGASLSRLWLPGVLLTSADLRGADLSGAVLNSVRFAGADLSHANLTGACLRQAAGVDPRPGACGVNLSYARLDEAKLTSADLRHANAKGATFRGAQLQSARCYHADLGEATFLGATLTGALLTRANLRGATFDAADLRGTRFDRADLRGASFVNADLDGASFRGATVDSGALDDLECAPGYDPATF